MKRIIVCFDGTWQSLNQPSLTNIGILARSIAHKQTVLDNAGNESLVYQNVIYTRGVGSSMGALEKQSFLEQASASFNRLAGGAFGEGLEDGIVDTYLRLAFDYEADDEIYIFGFSRGAFAARRLSGFINQAGIVSRRHVEQAREGYRLYHSCPSDSASDKEKQEHAEAAKQFRMTFGKGRRNPDGTRLMTDEVPKITYLGVFDTVAQRGISDVIAATVMPWGANRQRYQFKNNRISPNVENARHAMAVDEARIGFPVIPWEGLDDENKRLGRAAYLQKWFIGKHGDVGGGIGSNLSANALNWIAEGAKECGLRFYAKHGDDISPLDETLRDAGLPCINGDIEKQKFWDAIKPMNYPFRGRKIWTKRGKPSVQDLQAYLDDSVIQRANDEALRYHPPGLKPFRSAMKDMTRRPHR